MWDVVLDTLIDGAKLLPFLFVTYLLMEYLEKRMGDRAQLAVSRAGKLGPLIGGALGAIPQCGFAAAAGSLYSCRVITLGTLFAIFLSTSDEMVPILISHELPFLTILTLIGIKAAVGVAAGFIIDLLSRKRERADELRIEEMCESSGCRCEEGIFRSAIRHTVSIFLFILLISFALNTAVHFIGVDTLRSLVLSRPVAGELIAAAVGLIPNCAASVLLTELYVEGVLGAGALIAGLLTGAGVGLLVLFRTNKGFLNNLKITALLYAIGAGVGVAFTLLGFTV